MPEDYVFDATGAGGAATVRMSELFRGGDTLMMYHYMFPRHSRDGRAGPASGAMANVPLAEGPCPSCTALIDMWDGTMPHFEGFCGNLVVVARAAHRTCRRVRARQGLETYAVGLGGEQHVSPRLRRRRSG